MHSVYIGCLGPNRFLHLSFTGRVKLGMLIKLMQIFFFSFFSLHSLSPLQEIQIKGLLFVTVIRFTFTDNNSFNLEHNIQLQDYNTQKTP